MQTGHYLGLQSRVTCLAAMQNLVLVTNAEMQCASEHLFGFTALSHFAMSPVPSSAKISNPFRHNILSFVPNWNNFLDVVFATPIFRLSELCNYCSLATTQKLQQLCNTYIFLALRESRISRCCQCPALPRFQIHGDIKCFLLLLKLKCFKFFRRCFC